MHTMQIDHLPDTLLIEILQRLPSHLVFQCKAICKRWLTLISNLFFVHGFIHHHKSRLRHLPAFTLVHQFYYWHHHINESASRRIQAISEHPVLQTRDDPLLDFLPCFRHLDPWPTRIVASNGDLVVCHDYKMFSHQSMYYVCNVLTRQWRALPPIPTRHVEDDMATGLVTYGETDNRQGMIGLDEKRHLPVCKYKVVRILKHGPHSNHFIAEVYCSDTEEWSESLLTCPDSIRRFWQFRTGAVTVNHALHWIINGNNGEAILVLDPSRGPVCECRVMDPPPELKFEMAHVCLGTYGGELRVSTIKGLHPNRMLKVWELKDYGKGEWVLLYRICLKEMVFVNNECVFDLLKFSTNIVLGFHPNNGDVVYLRCHNHVMKCNIRNRTLEVVSKCVGDPTFVIRTLTVFPLLHPCWPSSVHGQLKH